MKTSTVVAIGAAAVALAGVGFALYEHFRAAKTSAAAAAAAAAARPPPQHAAAPSVGQQVGQWASLAGGLLGQAANLGLF